MNTQIAKHTSGPWRIVASAYDGGSQDVRGPLNKDKSSEYIATLSGCDETEANARLIAASPKMLEALEAVQEFASKFDGMAERSPQEETVLEMVHCAICEAKGEL